MKLDTLPQGIWFKAFSACWVSPFFFKTAKRSNNFSGVWAITRYPASAYLSAGSWLHFQKVDAVIQLNTADAEILECILNKYKEKSEAKWNGTDIVSISKFPLPYKKKSSVLKKGEILIVPAHESDWDGVEEF